MYRNIRETNGYLFVRIRFAESKYKYRIELVSKRLAILICVEYQINMTKFLHTTLHVNLAAGVCFPERTNKAQILMNTH